MRTERETMRTEPSPTGVAQPGRRVLPGLLALAVFAIALVGLVVVPNVDVIERGHLVDYTDREVVRVDVFGAFTMLAAPETKVDTDLLNTIALAILTGVATLAAVLTPPGRLRLFFGVAAAGSLLACFDEGFELTETIVYNADWLGDYGIPARKLDVLDAIPVAIFIWYFRDVLLSSRRALWFLAFGAVCFAFSLALEVAAASRVEDAVEVVASTGVVIGITLIAVERLRPATE